MKKGFTLIELMIVVAIIAILAMIAVPMYQSYIENARNTAAMALVKQFALANEAHNALPGGSYITTMGVAADGEVGALLPFGFRPDPNVIFHVIKSADGGGYVVFAASNTMGAPVYMYNSQSGQGAVPDDLTGGAHAGALTSFTFTPATDAVDALIVAWGTGGAVSDSTAAKPGEVTKVGKAAASS